MTPREDLVIFRLFFEIVKPDLGPHEMTTPENAPRGQAVRSPA
jgi:hypothetical protein